MVTCGYCKHDNEDRFNFCANCEKQIKCLHCGELLIVNKTRCLVCGKPISAYELNSNLMNEFVLDEKQDMESSSRHIEARFTDKVASEVAPFLSGIPSKINNANLKTQVSPTIPLLSSENVKPMEDCSCWW